MKLLITTDTHFDNLNMFATTTSSGYNSRFIKNLNIYKNILDYAREYSCYLLHLGDVFNRRILIPSDVLHLTYELISSYKDVTQYYIVGNHDMYSTNPNDTALKILSEMGHVNIITEPTQVYFQPNINLFMVPYGGLMPTIPAESEGDTYQILAFHYGVQEAKVGPKNYRLPSDLSISHLKKLNYDLTLIGHIHKPQALTDKIIIVGSPYQISFAESEETKYFYVFDCESRELVKYPTEAPKFLVLNMETEEDLKQTLDPNNYYRLNVLDPKITHEDMKPFVSDNTIISFVSQSAYDHDVEAVATTRSPQEEVDDYYYALETNLDKAVLVKQSKRIIGGS
jgi:DNA repair exonuclease SbcCD nuclease subunit